jgi:hypothetical protein
MKKYTTRKYMGDDCYSWAVFRKSDLPKGHRGIVFDYCPEPVMNGLSRSSAQHYARELDKKD